jgi:hypothetical protein
MPRYRVWLIAIVLGCVAGWSARLAAQLIYGTTGNASPNQILAVPVTSLTNFPLAVTLTARNIAGALVSEKSSRWSVCSQPAVSTQATASIAAEATVRHVADTLTYSAASGATAATATIMVLNLRDGATGAGTVIWTTNAAPELTPAINTNFISSKTIAGLNLVGTTNTAMTFEFSALLTNLNESVCVAGYNVQ